MLVMMNALHIILALVLLAGCNPSQSTAEQATSALPLPRITTEEALDLLQQGAVITASYHPDSGKINQAGTDDPQVNMAAIIQQSHYWCNDNGNLHLPGEMYPIANPETGTVTGEWGFGPNCEYVERTFSRGY